MDFKRGRGLHGMTTHLRFWKCQISRLYQGPIQMDGIQMPSNECDGNLFANLPLESLTEELKIINYISEIKHSFLQYSMFLLPQTR